MLLHTFTHTSTLYSCLFLPQFFLRANFFVKMKVGSSRIQLRQTVDIFTGCFHSAEGYFKTVVSEEPNACYFLPPAVFP